VVTNPLQAVAGASWLGVLLANGSTVALAREDRIRGNPQWVSEALAEPSAPRPMVTPSSGTTWRWRNPGGAPPEAIAGDGEFLGTRAGDFDRCERPSAGETLRG